MRISTMLVASALLVSGFFLSATLAHPGAAAFGDATRVTTPVMLCPTAAASSTWKSAHVTFADLGTLQQVKDRTWAEFRDSNWRTAQCGQPAPATTCSDACPVARNVTSVGGTAERNTSIDCSADLDPAPNVEFYECDVAGEIFCDHTWECHAS